MNSENPVFDEKEEIKPIEVDSEPPISKDSDSSGMSDKSEPETPVPQEVVSVAPAEEPEPFDYAKALEKSISDITNKTNKRFMTSYRILLREFDRDQMGGIEAALRKN